MLSNLLLPTSRLWLPGMALNPLGRFGVCADCCGIPCGECTGETPQEIYVDVSGFTGDMAGFNDTFVLQSSAPGWYDNNGGGPCCWVHILFPATCCWHYGFPEPMECNGYYFTGLSASFYHLAGPDRWKWWVGFNVDTGANPSCTYAYATDNVVESQPACQPLDFNVGDSASDFCGVHTFNYHTYTI